METIYFWKNWSKPERLLLCLSGIVLFTSLCVYTYRFYLGIDEAIQWEEVTETSMENFQADSFVYDLQEEPLMANNYLIKTLFQVEEISFDLIHTRLYLGFICFALILSMVGLSYIKQSKVFALASTLLAITLYFFSFDVLEVFGLQNNLFFSGAFVLISGATFLLNFVRNNRLSLLVRFLISFLVVTLVFTLALRGAHVDLPVLHLTNYINRSLSVIVLL
ncbi:hypothetical protein OAH12_00830, partial [Cyclobacteriaceae bacterium]|nr:hypothetical protein [Cyclobacteriaceae bacterium]